MPCYDGRNAPMNIERDLRDSFRHNSDVAELLCGLCQQLEARGLAHEINSSAARANWWKEHQRRDAKRRRK